MARISKDFGNHKRTVDEKSTHFYVVTLQHRDDPRHRHSVSGYARGEEAARKKVAKLVEAAKIGTTYYGNQIQDTDGRLWGDDEITTKIIAEGGIPVL